MDSPIFAGAGAGAGAGAAAGRTTNPLNADGAGAGAGAGLDAKLLMDAEDSTSEERTGAGAGLDAKPPNGRTVCFAREAGGGAGARNGGKKSRSGVVGSNVIWNSSRSGVSSKKITLSLPGLDTREAGAVECPSKLTIMPGVDGPDAISPP